jgi:putative phosphoribosyl transferase
MVWCEEIRLPFLDRTRAGKLLGERLLDVPCIDPVVLALPRGGVPVGYPVSLAMGAPLDIIGVRKLGVPYQPEVAMGAIGEDGVRVIDDDIVSTAGVSEREIRAVEARERAELDRQVHQFRTGRSRIPLEGRTAVVVDDGIATGSTARAACLVARAHGAARVIVATPTASRQAVAQLRDVADEVIALETPEPFFAVGQWYLDFDQTPDKDVISLLAESRSHWDHRLADPGGGGLSDPVDPADPPVRDEDVTAGAGSVRLEGHLTVPERARGMVVFVHGSGSSRHSPRNRFVAHVLNQAGLATLLFDLLTPDEEIDRSNVFDIALLGGRLVEVTRWLSEEPEVRGLGIGYFGASTGSAAALWAAADPQLDIGAVVSRGGRPDLAASRLPAVSAPTLLIVGERDEVVIDLNRQAQSQLTCESRLTIVPRATHLFEEPGTLQVAADLATHWFVGHLSDAG